MLLQVSFVGIDFYMLNAKVWKQGWKGQEKYLANNISQTTALIS